jgi:hypothetical protein
MTDDSATRELESTQRRLMRARTKLDDRRDALIEGLRDVERDASVMDAVLQTLFTAPR